MRGFHLLEIVLVIFIITLLAALSFPIYSAHLMRKNRLEATVMLSKLALEMEKYHLKQHTYEKTAIHFSKNNYVFYIQSASVHQYTLVAEPILKQAVRDTGCLNLTLNANGVKGITGDGKLGDCWR